MTYQKFLQYKEPDNYIFFNSKYTSPFTFNSEYLIDHTKTKGKLRNYDPLKQSFLFLPNDNPKRPIIVPQEYLILNDDSLLQEDIPQHISDPLPPLQHIASQPLGDCEKSYFHAMTKKGYSNNELIFIISHLLSLLTNGNHKEYKKAKHSDTTLQLLGKSLSYDFISMHNDKHSYSGHNPYNHLRIGVHDHLLNLLPLFNPDWFSQAFINFFGYPCYVLTQCGIYFSTFLFIREVLTFLLKFYRTISIKYNLQSNISILSSIAHGFFNIVTSEMVTDLNNTGKRKRIYTKHKITTSEKDNILLPEKELNNKQRHSDTDSPHLPPKHSSKNSTFQSPQKTHPTNVNDINSQDYDPILSNVIAVPESPAKIFIKFNPS